MNKRFKCITTINGIETVFKRYGESQKEVKNDLEQFIRKTFEGSSFQIQEIEEDKTHTIEDKK